MDISTLIYKIKQGFLNHYISFMYGLRYFRNNVFVYRDFAESNIKVDRDVVIYNTKMQGQVTAGKGSQINNSTVTGSVSIGQYTIINGPSTIIAAKHNNIKIGNYTSIAHNVSIIEYLHNTHNLSTSFLNKKIQGKSSKLDTYSKGDINIGSDVWIGAGAVVLSGVTIGNGAVIGANSVVTEDVPDYSIAGGIPARVFKYRFEESIIKELLAIDWYNLDLTTIKKLGDIINEPVTHKTINQISKIISQ